MRASEGSGTAVAPTAVVLTVGTELAEGLRPDTNGPEISRRLASAGYILAAREVLPDDRTLICSRMTSDLAACDLVVITGGLGPTHDDVTRDAAADALGLTLVEDPTLIAGLAAVQARHSSREGAEQVMRQALILPGATILRPTTGTAPGQLLATGTSTLMLLPGPPHELRPMLEEGLALLASNRVPEPRIVRCAQVMESDVQIEADRILADFHDMDLTVLASDSLLDIVLIPRGASSDTLDAAALAVAKGLGQRCYSADGGTLAGSVVSAARVAGCTLAVAESCTGGLIAAELSSIPGASAVFLGGFVTYSNEMKTGLLGVSEETLARHGAVSEAVARAMALGVREATGAGLTIAVTGIAGPDGGTPGKPVGTVWIALADAGGARATLHHFRGDRSVVRRRATVTALDTVRLALREFDGCGG